MTIQRIGDEVIIKIPDSASVAELQHLLDYLNLRMSEMKSMELQRAVDLLAREVNKGWWEANKDKFLNP